MADLDIPDAMQIALGVATELCRRHVEIMRHEGNDQAIIIVVSAIYANDASCRRRKKKKRSRKKRKPKSRLQRLDSLRGVNRREFNSFVTQEAAPKDEKSKAIQML